MIQMGVLVLGVLAPAAPAHPLTSDGGVRWLDRGVRWLAFEVLER